MPDIDIDGLPIVERARLFVACFAWMQKKGGFLPKEAYFARLRTFPTVYTEVITFARDAEGYHVLLDLRPGDDPYYPNMYGSQGGTLMMRETNEDVLKKHVAKESGIPFASLPLYTGTVCAPLTERDHAVVIVFGRIVEGKPEKHLGTFLPMKDYLNTKVVPSNRAYVDLAFDVLVRGQMPQFREYLGTGA